MHLQWGFFVNAICTKCSSCKNVNPPTILYVTIICVTNNEQCWIFHAYKKAKLLFIVVTKSRMFRMYSSAVTLSKEFFQSVAQIFSFNKIFEDWRIKITVSFLILKCTFLFILNGLELRK